MNQKTVFLVSAILASLFLCFNCLVITGLITLDKVDPGDGISFFNLLVDIAVGFFTVWGLFWAASEFAESAIKPVLRLLPGKGRRPQIVATRGGKSFPLKGRSSFYILGWTEQPLIGSPPVRDPHILLDLYLENEKPRAGRHVYLVIRVHTVPAPMNCEIIEFPDERGLITEREKKDSGIGNITVSKQFPEDFVVINPLSTLGRCE